MMSAWRTTIFLFVTCAAYGPLALYAGDAPSVEVLDQRLAESVTMPDLVDYALQASPAVAAARENWRAGIESYRSETGYPDPQIMATYFPDPIETRLGPQDWNVTVSQMIPFPGKLSKKGAVIEIEEKIGRIRYDQSVRNVIADIKESFFELYYIREAKKIAGANLRLAEHLRTVGEAAYAQNRSAFMDVTKAQSQMAQLRYDALLLDELEQAETTRINALLNRPPESALGQLAPPPFVPLALSPADVFNMMENNREEIRVAELQVEKAGRQLGLARLNNLPDFRVGLFYAGIGDPDVPMPPEDAGRDAAGVQFGMTLPLWFGKNAGRVSGARAAVRKARAEKESAVNDARAQVHKLYFRIKNAERLVTLYADELLPQAQRAVETAETWFREGEGSFSDFVETQATLYNFQLSLARARADHGKYTAGLERAAGTPLTAGTAAPAKGDQ